MARPSPPVPERAIGALSLTAIAVNTIVGAGIFALPGTVALLLGPASVLAYLAAGGAILLIALCFAEAGSRFEASGGPYVYARAAFGEFAGFEIGWLFVVARLTAVAAVSNTFADYLGYFWPALTFGTGRFLAITVMIGTLAASHYFGVRLGTAVNNLFTIGKLLPLCAFSVAGLFLLHLNVVSVTPLPGARPLQQASLLLTFALGGFENASIPSEEVINPKRSLPVAVLASVGVVIVLYLAIQVVTMAALPGLGADVAPLAAAARKFLGPGGAVMLTAGAVLSTAGSNHTNFFAGPRVLYALGRDGCLPARFAWLHPRYRTPALSTVLYALAGWVAALSGAFAPLAALSAISRLLVYTGTCLAVLVLRRQKGPPPGFRLPFGPLIPVCAFGVCTWLLLGSSARQASIVAMAVLAGALVYASTRVKT